MPHSVRLLLQRVPRRPRNAWAFAIRFAGEHYCLITGARLKREYGSTVPAMLVGCSFDVAGYGKKRLEAQHAQGSWGRPVFFTAQLLLSMGGANNEGGILLTWGLFLYIV